MNQDNEQRKQLFIDQQHMRSSNISQKSKNSSRRMSLQDQTRQSRRNSSIQN